MNTRQYPAPVIKINEASIIIISMRRLLMNYTGMVRAQIIEHSKTYIIDYSIREDSVELVHDRWFLLSSFRRLLFFLFFLSFLFVWGDATLKINCYRKFQIWGHCFLKD